MCINYSSEKNLSMTNSTGFYKQWVPKTAVDIGIYDLFCSLPGILINSLFIFVIIRNWTSFGKPLSLLLTLSVANLFISIGVFSMGLTDVITDSEEDYWMIPYQCFYKRPQLTFIIVGIQLQSCATLLVATERLFAVCFPYQYFYLAKTRLIMGAICICILFVISNVAAAISLSITLHGFTEFSHEACYPALVAGLEFGGFLYAFPATVGLLSVLFYLIILILELKHKKYWSKKNGTSATTRTTGRNHNSQTWLIKISIILACSSFLFVVVPYTVLFVGRYHTVTHSIMVPYLRRYVTFALSANSFFGIMFCFFVSAELRKAAKSTLLCKKLIRSPCPSSVQLSRQQQSSSSSFITRSTSCSLELTRTHST